MARSGSSGKCHDKADPDHPKPRELRDIQCHLTAFPTLAVGDCWVTLGRLRDTRGGLNDTECHASAPFCPVAHWHARGCTVAKSVGEQIRPHL